jgi:hypothetical protein
MTDCAPPSGDDQASRQIVYQLYYTTNLQLFTYNLWLFAVLFKLLPCCTLGEQRAHTTAHTKRAAVVSLLLIRDISRAQHRHTQLMSTRNSVNTRSAQRPTDNAGRHTCDMG